MTTGAVHTAAILLTVLTMPAGNWKGCSHLRHGLTFCRQEGADWLDAPAKR
jgi:hypothetical protein